LDENATISSFHLPNPKTFILIFTIRLTLVLVEQNNVRLTEVQLLLPQQCPLIMAPLLGILRSLGII
jgi:hypothetical protein